jgi:cytosine/adenosine deaminase-related metal-dependent hydrolase
VLAAGANADVAIWPVEGLPFAGAISDPIDAWMRCGPSAPRHLLVAGRAIVSDGRLAVIEPGPLDELLQRHRAAARRLQAG